MPLIKPYMPTLRLYRHICRSINRQTGLNSIITQNTHIPFLRDPHKVKMIENVKIMIHFNKDVNSLSTLNSIIEDAYNQCEVLNALSEAEEDGKLPHIYLKSEPVNSNVK